MPSPRVQDSGQGPEANDNGASDFTPQVRSVLVVGGTGFVGQHLVGKLAGRGRVARVLTRNPQAAQTALHRAGIELVEGNYRDPVALDAALDGVDAVCHLAKGEGRNWQEYLDNDVEPTRQVAEAALRRGVRRFIYVGSIDSYASASAADRIDGSTALDPRIERRNHYARSKATCEQMLLEMARDRGLPLVILRLGIVIGAGSSPIHYGVGRFSAWNRLTFWGDGTHKLPFVLVEDAADALVRALEAPGIEQCSFLITDAPLLSARDYVAAMQARSGGRVHAAPRAIWRYWLADLAREMVKTAIRHPNRHLSSLHDWECRSHRATYDSAQSAAALGWRPAGTRQALIERGIYPAVEAML
ncbi:NAD(P)-dependent oxidoreductase [Sphingobium sp. H39-3-25]|uniref:NAD-dependent epimerase/dehydratase family protein n=1 Tax=Sphingobium arseniciresistens TaxID=3030834 RepID=UPI0023B9A5D8|nr:NAD(P)-dependent oxidoreductase [Sphingobium arseniciresistens]